MSAMTTPPKVVKLGTSQVRQPPRMRSQALNVEDDIKVFAAEKQEDEKITEDKKIEQNTDEKKPTGRKKVKMRSKREEILVVHVEFPIRSHRKKKGPRNRHPRLRKTKGNGKGTKQRC